MDRKGASPLCKGCYISYTIMFGIGLLKNMESLYEAFLDRMPILHFS